MNKNHSVGYIVSCSKLGPMRVNRFGLPRLYTGGEVTIFSSKAQIKTAVDNTKEELAEPRYRTTIDEVYGSLTIHRVKRPQQRIKRGR